MYSTAPLYAILAARPLDLAHLPGIERRAARLLEDHAPLSVLAETTNDEDFRAAQVEGRLWVAVAGGEPVGFALVEMLDDGLPHLEEIDVDPAHGRRGLGTLLVRAVCEWTVERSYAELTLTTQRAVPFNMPFYAKLGFAVVPDAEQRPALVEVVREEASRGLHPAARCVMRWRPR